MHTLFLLLILALLFPLPAAEFRSEKECVIGASVTDRQNRTGKVVSVKNSMCEVALDGSTRRSYLFWMLRAAGASAETDDKLVPGRYKCTGLMEVRILSANTYLNVGKQGTFRIEPNRKIVFETGPLSSYSAKLLPGPVIGLNANGGNFYGTTCRLAAK